jgi:hypothetical protein
MFRILLPEHTQYYNDMARGVLGRSVKPRGERDPGNRLRALKEKDKYRPSVGGSSPQTSPKADLEVALLLLQKELTNYRTNWQQNGRQLTSNRLTSRPLHLEARSKCLLKKKIQETPNKVPLNTHLPSAGYRLVRIGLPLVGHSDNRH